MARKCPITGKGPQSGCNVSHSNRHVKTRWKPNLQHKRIWVAEENRWVRVRVSTRAIRTIDKNGLPKELLR